MNVWKQCEYMFQYHSSLNATHPYSSTWKQWLLDLRPIWYYNGYDANDIQHTISCFSNPLMTWLSLGAIVFTVLDGIRTKKQSALVIVIGYITALAPWMIITRCVFAYHFYPTSIFAIIWHCGKKCRLLLYCYVYFIVCCVLAGNCWFCHNKYIY